MPKIASWDNLPPGIRQRLIDRMRDRAIGIADLNRRPKCRRVTGTRPKTFLPHGQAAKGEALIDEAMEHVRPRRP